MDEQLCCLTECPTVTDAGGFALAPAPTPTPSVRKLKREAAAQRRKLLAAQSGAMNMNLNGDEINAGQHNTASPHNMDRDGRYQRRRRKDANSANRKHGGSQPKNGTSAKQFGDSILPTPSDNDIDTSRNDSLLLAELDPNGMPYTDPHKIGSNPMLWPPQPSSAANCRRRQAVRGPRNSGVRQLRPPLSAQAAAPPASAPVFNVKNCSCGCDQRQRLAQFLLHDQEDHRVLSTEFHAAATQATVKVTILAAGFVIGARGISARLIGQVTGAAVHSWTESGYNGNGSNSNGNRVWQGSNQQAAAQMAQSPQTQQQQHHQHPPQMNQPLHLQEMMASGHGIPVRLFRIEGKKVAVQAAVALIQDAVAKYKELCELKRRGEFVQREHLIGGVEFYYQPPPRKAFANQPGQPGQPGGIQFCGCGAGLRPRPCCSSSSDAIAAADPNFNPIPDAGIFSNFSYPQPFHHMHHHNPSSSNPSAMKSSANWFLQQQQEHQQHFSSSAALQPFVNNFTLRQDSGSIRQHTAPQLRTAPQDQPSSFRWPMFRQKSIDPSSNLGSYMSPGSAAPPQGFHSQLQSLFDEFSSPATPFRQYSAAAGTSPSSVMENHSQDQLSDYSSSLLQKLQVSSSSSSVNSAAAASSAAAAAASNDSNRSNCSLFSVFGNGGHPVPIARANSGSSLNSGDGDIHQNGTAAELLQNSNNCSSQTQSSKTPFISSIDSAHSHTQMMSSASSSAVISSEAAAGLMGNSERVAEYCLFGSMQSIYNDFVDNHTETANNSQSAHGGLMIDTGLGFPSGCSSAAATAADVARACLCSSIKDQN